MSSARWRGSSDDQELVDHGKTAIRPAPSAPGPAPASRGTSKEVGDSARAPESFRALRPGKRRPTPGTGFATTESGEKVMDSRRRVLILGAAGRDFHDFNSYFRDRDHYEVVGFTATQIPHIEDRRYPAELAGPLYPQGIPIHPEAELEELIENLAVEQVVLSYSDLKHETVMSLASRALSAGAGFRLLGPGDTMLASSRPVIAICAVRTGCGKSQTCRYIARALRRRGVRPVVIRHPMPYGDLLRQRVQRFASSGDLDAQGDNITIEEREEYEPHVAEGTVVFAGVDYRAVLEAAEGEADVILWDGGNNDLPFLRPDLWITLADPHRAGHELSYHPGESNFRAADIILINKADSASEGAVSRIRASAARLNPRAKVLVASSEVTAESPETIRGKRVLLVEDGPTLTHGEMPFGAGQVAADQYGAAEVIDPRPFARGSLREVYQRFPHLGKLVPALGYWPEQVRDLEETIGAADCDAVIIATPVDLRHLMRIRQPSTRVRYELRDLPGETLEDEIGKFVSRIGSRADGGGRVQTGARYERSRKL
jgi:predicted GTPase